MCCEANLSEADVQYREVEPRSHDSCLTECCSRVMRDSVDSLPNTKLALESSRTSNEPGEGSSIVASLQVVHAHSSADAQGFLREPILLTCVQHFASQPFIALRMQPHLTLEGTLQGFHGYQPQLRSVGSISQPR